VGTGIEDYLWSTGDTTASIHFLPDIYDTVYTLSVMVSNQLNCHYYDTVDVHVMREASIAFELDTLQECTGNNVDLNVLASANIVSFRWIYQEIDSITIFDELTLIEPLVSANIYVEGTSSGGCLVTDSTFLQILPYPDFRW